MASNDIVSRARAALEGVTEGPWEHHIAPHSDSTETPAEYLAASLIGSGEPLHVLTAQSSEPRFAYVLPAVTGDGPTSAVNADFIAAARELVPDLVAEIERLRTAGPWVEHVERQRAMKRERDGECICNTGPDTEGPDEFCPWHGRTYNELLEIIVRQQDEINTSQPEGV